MQLDTKMTLSGFCRSWPTDCGAVMYHKKLQAISCWIVHNRIIDSFLSSQQNFFYGNSLFSFDLIYFPKCLGQDLPDYQLIQIITDLIRIY